MGPQSVDSVVPGAGCLEEWVDELRTRVRTLLDESRQVKEVLDRMAERAREEEVAFVFSREQAEALIREVPPTLHTLRELPERIEALTERTERPAGP
ncbi:hypothetical protein [Streptomyces venezuelae]|uniref:hypothetical protein n=1 Tax=Streptomyces venezuelae TaxID=54571 RepID=UPI0037B88E78